MSRIGKRVLSIPENVNVNVDNNTVTVKGPKGELTLDLVKGINVKVEDNTVVVEMTKNDKFTHAMHGTTNANIRNMIIGVSEGYKKVLELVGVGYRVSNQGNVIEFSLGYTHPIFMELPKEVKVETKSERNQNPILTLESCDKQLLGLVCAKIRSFRKPEPYKGKGILFKGEVIRRKSGKSASAK